MMKFSKFARLFALITILSLIAVLLPVSIILAVGEVMAVFPNHGEIGDNVEIAGTGFTASSDYDLYFSSERASISDEINYDVLNYEFLVTVDIDSSGTFDEYFDIPSWLRDGEDDEKVLGGSYWIYATKLNDETIVARIEFTVEAVASITSISPSTGTVGTEVDIDGEGYSNNEDLIVEYDGVAVSITAGDTSTNSNGSFNNARIVIPASTSGTHTITVIGDDSNLEAEEQFTVTPEMTVSPGSGPPGTAITVTGSGFGDEVAVTIYFDDSVVTQASTDSDGSFTANFGAPVIGEGIYIIKAVDAGSHSDNENFSVGSSSVNLVPNKGSIGTTVAVTGSGFIKNTTVVITFDATTIATVTSDAGGAISASFNVPTATVGDHSVVADDGTNASGMKFNIITSAEINPQTSATSPGIVGDDIIVSGMGFTAGGAVLVTYDGTQIATATVDANGNFSVKFSAPPSTGGAHTIKATQGTNTQSLTYYMETTPPSTPVLLLPETGTKSSASAHFDWEDVTDPSGVTYILQIATDSTFSADSLIFQMPNISESQYTMPKEQRLNNVSEETPYYWRVKAMDNAANEGDWSDASTFTVGFSFGISQTWIYVIIGICAILLAVFAFWMGRKTAYY